MNNKLFIFLAVVFLAGLLGNAILAVVTFGMIVTYGEITYQEPNNFILYSEFIFSILILIGVVYITIQAIKQIVEDYEV